MVGVTGIEPVTPSMSTKCSPAELHAHCHWEQATRRHLPDISPEAVRISGIIRDDKSENPGPIKGLALARGRSGRRHQPVHFRHQIA